MDKTDNKTETKSDKSNRNKERLPFTDSAIQKWLPGFFERGEPMVCTIEDAYRCFMGTDLYNILYENKGRGISCELPILRHFRNKKICNTHNIP